MEKLRLGDEVITLLDGPQPIRWIGQRIYRRHFARLNPNSIPVLIKADAFDDGVPSRDLSLSPSHNIYIDGRLIPVGQLVNNSSVLLHEEMDPIAYHHLELPTHSVILAENLPAESYTDRGDRAMFMNASASDRIDGTPRAQAWSTCAPIVQSGPEVDRMRARLALRAGITPDNIMDRPQTGPLLGKLEWADRSVISGWAWLSDHADIPVVLEVLDRSEVIAVTVAEHYRDDLRRAGIGNGRHAFHVDLPRPLDPQQPHQLIVRRAADGLALPGCPLDLPARLPSNALVGLDLAVLIENADPAETRRVLDWLEQQAVKLHTRLLTIPDARAPTAGRTPAVAVVPDRRGRRIKVRKTVRI